MASTGDLEIYNKLNSYYDITNNLNAEINKSDEISIQQKRDVLYPIIDEIKKLTDEMLENYVFYLKDKENLEKLEEVQKNISNILERIDYFKNKIYEVYRINDKSSS